MNTQVYAHVSVHHRRFDAMEKMIILNSVRTRSKYMQARTVAPTLWCCHLKLTKRLKRDCTFVSDE